MLLGLDVGGTFTDAVIMKKYRERVLTTTLPDAPQAPTAPQAEGGVIYAPALWHGLRGYPGLSAWNQRPELHDQALLDRLYRASRQVTGI